MRNLILDDIDITPILKAQKRLSQFLQHLETDQEKAGAIQAFEYCFELSWKFLKKILLKKGVEVASPRDSFRQSAANELIKDPVVWFGFIKKRNLTAHTYNEDTAQEVVDNLHDFQKEFDQLIQNLKELS